MYLFRQHITYYRHEETGYLLISKYMTGYLNLVFTTPECLQNSIKWSLPVKHPFILYLKYYSSNMFRLAI